MKIAGILTIGNEILQGFTLDTNAKKFLKSSIREILILLYTLPYLMILIKSKKKFKSL